jgi:hypothetical protein
LRANFPVFEKTSKNKLIMKSTKKQVKFTIKPIHPGTILREEILIPRDISPQELAQAIKVSKEQIK